MINVQQMGNAELMEFSVTIEETNGHTQHQVTMSQSTYKELTGTKVSPSECVEAAFKFLLDREPKESILSHFDITVISTYFPNFERDLRNYL